jgi:hypothetical protein
MACVEATQGAVAGHPSDGEDIKNSKSALEVLDELIPEVLLSTLKPYINIKLQNRHAQVNLLYHGG